MKNSKIGEKLRDRRPETLRVGFFHRLNTHGILNIAFHGRFVEPERNHTNLIQVVAQRECSRPEETLLNRSNSGILVPTIESLGLGKSFDTQVNSLSVRLNAKVAF